MPMVETVTTARDTVCCDWPGAGHLAIPGSLEVTSFTRKTRELSSSLEKCLLYKRVKCNYQKKEVMAIKKRKKKSTIP